jgi:hypothetical protein
MNPKNDSELSVSLNTGEFWFLLQQFGTGIVLGLKNPYLGWLIEEIEDANRTALRSLVDRDIVRVISKNQIEIDDMLASIIKTCLHPQQTVISQFQDSKGVDKQHYIYFGNNLIVEHIEFKRGQHFLTAIKDRYALLAHLSEVLRLSSEVASRGKKFRLPEQVLFESRSLCSQGQARKALNYLKKEKLSEVNAALLARALTNPVANSAFAAIRNQDQPQIQNVKGFALLEGENDFWIMIPYERGEEKMVEFIPANSKMAKQHFLEILPPLG